MGLRLVPQFHVLDLGNADSTRRCEFFEHGCCSDLCHPTNCEHSLIGIRTFQLVGQLRRLFGCGNNSGRVRLGFEFAQSDATRCGARHVPRFRRFGDDSDGGGWICVGIGIKHGLRIGLRESLPHSLHTSPTVSGKVGKGNNRRDIAAVVAVVRSERLRGLTPPGSPQTARLLYPLQKYTPAGGMFNGTNLNFTSSK